jgi:hypothetical protein
VKRLKGHARALRPEFPPCLHFRSDGTAASRTA